MDVNKIFRLVSVSEAAKFRYNEANRITNQNHVIDFVDSIIKSKSMLRYGNPPVVYDAVPVCVNPKTLNILDGQHRVQAFLRTVTSGKISPDTRIMVHFLECDPEEEIKKIQELNSKSKNWTTGDFVKVCINSGSENYKKLRDFANAHCLCWGKGKLLYSYAHLLLKGTLGDTSIREGNFVTTDEELAIGHEVHEEIVALREILGITSKNNPLQRMIIIWRRYRNNITVRDVQAIAHSFKHAITANDWKYVRVW